MANKLFGLWHSTSKMKMLTDEECKEIIVKEFDEWLHRTHSEYSMMCGVGVGELARGVPDYKALRIYYDQLIDLNIQILRKINDVSKVRFLHAPYYFIDKEPRYVMEQNVINISDKTDLIVDHLAYKINDRIKYDYEIWVYMFIRDFHIVNNVYEYSTQYKWTCADIKKQKITFWEKK